MNDSRKSVAVIGAGISGLVLASALKETARVTVFEKSRGPGGRMSTRRQDGIQYDHGAQYFTARGRRFKKFLQPYLAAGAVDRWHAKITTLTKGPKNFKRIWFEPHYVGRPAMNSLCQAIGQEIDAHYETRISPLTGDSPPWDLHNENDDSLGRFDWVVTTAPAVQSAALLPSVFGDESGLTAPRMSGCHTLMLNLDADPAQQWDAAVIKDSPLEWLAFNHRKPGRTRERPTVIINSTNAWAEQTFADSDETVTQTMLEELQALTGIDPESIKTATLQRWHFAAVEQPAGKDFLIDPAHHLAACGDWCIGSRVEAAFLSATRLATALSPLL